MHKSKEVAGCHLGHKSARKCKSTELASLRVRKSEKSQTGRMGARRFENLGHPIRRGEERRLEERGEEEGFCFMFVELNYKKRGERGKGGGEEKKKRGEEEEEEEGGGEEEGAGKRKEAMV